MLAWSLNQQRPGEDPSCVVLCEREPADVAEGCEPFVVGTHVYGRAGWTRGQSAETFADAFDAFVHRRR